MIRLAIGVEGETEEEFVKRVLATHLTRNGINAQPVLMMGDVTVERLASEMAHLFWSHDYVTSLVDFYGFRRKGDVTPNQLQERINSEVNRKISRDWNESRVFSYVQQYEFEGLLFSDVDAFDTCVDLPVSATAELRRIRSQFETPEHINDDPMTAPSKRILSLIPKYHKRVDGPIVAESIGLNTIRGQCRRFNSWFTRLETLGHRHAPG